MKRMEDKKKKRAACYKEQKGAVLLLKSEGELTLETQKTFTLPEIKILLKWKRVKPESILKKDLVNAHIAAPKPKIQKVWCRSEEAALVALQSVDVDMKDTAVGVVATQMAKALGNDLASLNDSSRSVLMQTLQDFDDSSNPNAI